MPECMQRLWVYDPAGPPMPTDLAEQIRLAVERALAGAQPEAWSAWSDTLDVDDARAITLPVRVDIGQLRTTFEVQAWNYQTPGWLMPMISVLSAIGLVLPAAGVLLVVSWSIGAWKRRRWRKRPGLCGICGYDMTGLGVCPECGGG